MPAVHSFLLPRYGRLRSVEKWRKPHSLQNKWFCYANFYHRGLETSNVNLNTFPNMQCKMKFMNKVCKQPISTIRTCKIFWRSRSCIFSVLVNSYCNSTEYVCVYVCHYKTVVFIGHGFDMFYWEWYLKCRHTFTRSVLCYEGVKVTGIVTKIVWGNKLYKWCVYIYVLSFLSIDCIFYL
jgi:hypothetical protein